MDAAEITAEAADSMKAAEWLLAARAAGSKLPSTATRELAVSMLRSREAARALFTAAGSNFEGESTHENDENEDCIHQARVPYRFEKQVNQYIDCLIAADCKGVA